MENHLILSLRNWPKQSISGLFKLSPTTLRVVKNANVQLDSVLPVSFAQFVLQNNLMNTSKTQVQDLYKSDLDRRDKKIQILHQIWEKIKNQRSKSTRQSLTTKTSYLLRRQKSSIQRNSTKSQRSLKVFQKKKQKQPQKPQSPKHGPTYYDYYSTNSKKKANSKRSEQQQTTQSRRQKTSSTRNNQEYMQANPNRYRQRDEKQSNRKKQNLLNSMSLLLKKWSQVDLKHMQQVGELQQQIADHERRRLLKIHRIEKQKLRKQIESMRSGIISFKKSSVNFI